MHQMITTIMAINKRTGILMLLILALAIPAAAQDWMVPDDFDWSSYQQYGDSSFQDDWSSYQQYGDSSFLDDWGTAPQPQQPDTSWQEPITYSWYGQTYEINDPGSSYDPYYGTGGDYFPVAVTPDPGYYPDDDGWFYQITDGFFDDFGEWDRSTLPQSAYVSGFVGYRQSYNLDCEARSAVDLAAYFGVNIAHSEFLYNLPKSDDPNEGFVGSFTDARGNIPPASYGVYQEPVAALLRNYGLNAYGAYAYTEDALKRQISSGKPVMVWVVGNTEIGYSRPYTAASTGRTTYVVPFQHTVVVIGYDANGVTIQDGEMRYTRDWNTFLISWGALGNRAIYIR